MSVNLVELAISANAPAELARFWARALGWDLRRLASDVVALVPTDATSFRLVFGGGATAKAGHNRSTST